MKRHIVFWLPQGRMGNLIFQYQAAISIFAENSVIIGVESEFSEAFEVASIVKIVPLPKALRSRVTFYWVNLLRWCVRKEILGSVISKWEVVGGNSIETTVITKRPGWFSKIWVMEGYFQHDHYAIPSPKLRQRVLDRAEILLHQIPEKRRVAVHLRFGDYAKWTVLGKQGVCLPRSYYNIAMDQIAGRVKNPVFVIFSDDRQIAETIIGNKYETIYFDGGAPGVDIAGMTLCSHAIISASTFSWWGAFLMNYPMRIIIAPKYWAGFKSRDWFPKDIQTKYFEYIDAVEYENQGKNEES